MLPRIVRYVRRTTERRRWRNKKKQKRTKKRQKKLVERGFIRNFSPKITASRRSSWCEHVGWKSWFYSDTTRFFIRESVFQIAHICHIRTNKYHKYHGANELITLTAAFFWDTVNFNPNTRSSRHSFGHRTDTTISTYWRWRWEILAIRFCNTPCFNLRREPFDNDIRANDPSPLIFKLE